jgi:hypothetical protein
MKTFIVLVATGFICLLAGVANGLSLSHSQEFGRQARLTVAPVEVQTFSQVTEPNDIQPALGYNMVQRTTNPQAQVQDY